MTDDVTLTIYDSEDNQISIAKTTSIREYAMQKLETSTNDEFKTALVDMLNYGAAAQSKFGYKTDDLANSQLTDAQKNLGTSTLKTVANNRVSDSEYFIGSNLRFSNKTNLLFAFKNITAADCYAVFTWTDHKGVAHEVKVDGSEFAIVSGGYSVELDQLVVADARQMVTCTLYDLEGNVITVAVDSIEGNVARVSATNQALYESFMKFADSAYAYLHPAA